jgi:hypothetical protein
MEIIYQNKKRKKAQGHVEMIMSFVLFVSVIMLLFLFLNPFATTEERDFSIESIQRILLKEMNIDVGKVSVIVDSEGGCYNLPILDKRNPLEVFDAESRRKYTIYFSDLFEEYTPNKDENCVFGSYELGAYSQERIMHYPKIAEIKARYDGDYSGLKTMLNMPADFAFNLRDIDGNQVPELSVSRNIPAGVERTSKEFPVRVLDNSGKVSELILNIRAW